MTTNNMLNTRPPATVFNDIAIQRVTATGAFTYTPNAKMVYCIIELQGGGGGSGGTTGTAGQAAASGAGAGGGYYKIVATADQIGGSATGSVGIAGIAGTSGNNAGGTGGDTSITIGGGTNWIAAGGGGGGGQTSSAAAQGSGTAGVANANTLGTNATLIQVNVGGFVGAGFTSAAGGTVSNVVPEGGGAFLGERCNRNSTTGGAGIGNGGGCSGAINTSGANSAGGAGKLGIVIITEFLKA